MKTESQNQAGERTQRIETELAKFKAADLDKPMYDLDENLLRDLATEEGHASAKSYLNDHNAWNMTLAEAVTDLVNSIYTLDGVTYGTQAELDAAANK